MKIVSLGSSCAVKLFLLNKYYKNEETNIFDYIWNCDGGLINVTNFINNNLSYVTLENFKYIYHGKFKDKQHLVHKQFHNMALIHYNLNNEFIGSFNRKIDRFQKILHSSDKIFFVYFRQHTEPINTGDYTNMCDIKSLLDFWKKESLIFVNFITKKYPLLKFHLISLITISDPNDNKFEKYLDNFLKQNYHNLITFDKVIKSYGINEKNVQKSWDIIYTKYLK